MYRPSIRYSHPILAWEYDQRNKLEAAEFEWYLKYARSVGEPILELACGTGRLTIPLRGACGQLLCHGDDRRDV